jgi:CheY-like chemotaxis protein
MQDSDSPFALRFLGFSSHEADILEATLPVVQGARYRYFRLPEDSLQDADMFLVNAENLAALADLSALGSSELRPALLIGTPPVDLPHPCISRPIRWNRLFDALDGLMDRRRQALSRLNAAPHIMVPERRRRNRLDLDLTDPAEYLRMRAAPGPARNVLLVDRTPAFRDVLADTLKSYDITVDWVASADAALAAFADWRHALVLINTATPEIHPYRLCHDIKQQAGDARSAVILLTDKAFGYDRLEAKVVNCDGFLEKPLLAHQFLPVLNKFLPLSR